MKKLSKQTLNKEINRMEKDLRDELETNGITKRACFLKATINIYLKQLGMPEEY